MYARIVHLIIGLTINNLAAFKLNNFNVVSIKLLQNKVHVNNVRNIKKLMMLLNHVLLLNVKIHFTFRKMAHVKNKNASINKYLMELNV